MVTYIVIEHDYQKDVIETSKPFFSHEDATKEMWVRYGKALDLNAEEAKKYADDNGIHYNEHSISEVFYEAEVHSILFSEDDMLTMHILETFYDMYPEFNDYKKGEWRAKFQDMLVYHINHLLPRYKKDYLVSQTEDFIHDVLIGEELYQVAVAELGGDVNRTYDILQFIDENPKFRQIFVDEYGMKDAWMCGMLVLSNGDEEMAKKVRQAINEWCDETKQTHIFVEPQYVYRVYGYYDMDICQGEEIIQEIFATEELAKNRCKQLIAQWKQNGYTKEDSDDWDETETKLWAYCNSEWNVDINYTKELVKTLQD